MATRVAKSPGEKLLKQMEDALALAKKVEADIKEFSDTLQAEAGGPDLDHTCPTCGNETNADDLLEDFIYHLDNARWSSGEWDSLRSAIEEFSKLDTRIQDALAREAGIK